METRYKYRINIACPEDLMVAGNHLMVAVGESQYDFYTFLTPSMRDLNGMRYATASLACTEDFFTKLNNPLVTPNYAPDGWSMVLANEGKAAFVLFQTSDAAQLASDKIIGVIGDNPQSVFASLGLTLLSIEAE